MQVVDAPIVQEIVGEIGIPKIPVLMRPKIVPVFRLLAESVEGGLTFLWAFKIPRDMNGSRFERYAAVQHPKIFENDIVGAVRRTDCIASAHEFTTIEARDIRQEISAHLGRSIFVHYGPAISQLTERPLRNRSR